MKEITFKELANNIKKGDCFLRKEKLSPQHTCWDLFRAKPGVRFKPSDNETISFGYLEGLVAWQVVVNKDPFFKEPEDWSKEAGVDLERLNYNQIASGDIFYLRHTYYYTLSEEELQFFLVILQRKKQEAQEKALAKADAKVLHDAIQGMSLDFPELVMGQSAFLKTKGCYNSDKNFLEINLNTEIPFLAASSVSEIETAVLAKGKELGYKLEGVVLVPRNFSKGGYPAAGFKVRVYLGD